MKTQKLRWAYKNNPKLEEYTLNRLKKINDAETLKNETIKTKLS